MKVKISEQSLHFKIPARTSRGSYSEHRMLLVTLSDGKRSGTGECAPLPDLSCDRAAYNDPASVIRLISDSFSQVPEVQPDCAAPRLQAIVACSEASASGAPRVPPSSTALIAFSLASASSAAPLAASSLGAAQSSCTNEFLNDYPALKFAVESATAQMQQWPELYDTAFARGEIGIPINGLVWMADYDEMLRQTESKIEQGYRCIKLKIGAIDWQKEISIIRSVRSRFNESELELRVDANGAFSPDEAMNKLSELAQYGIHSIEQPIRQGQWDTMSRLCRESPLPIALDEELIGVNDRDGRIKLLETIRPQYIVVKPTLHGGLSGAHEWICLARERNIASWITSALESNIGLKSIALFCAGEYGITAENVTKTMPQGLGTGQLFIDNIETGIYIKDGSVWLSAGMEQ